MVENGVILNIYLPKQKMYNISTMQEHTPLISLCPLNNSILYLNKPKIMENSGELSDLEYLLTKTEKVKYLQNAGKCTSRLFGPFKRHYIVFKQA